MRAHLHRLIGDLHAALDLAQDAHARARTGVLLDLGWQLRELQGKMTKIRENLDRAQVDWAAEMEKEGLSA